MTDLVRDSILLETSLLVPLSSLPPAPGYGIDLVCIDDIDHRMAETSPLTNQSLSQDLYHRVTTPHGSLPDDPDYGIDLKGKLSSGQTPQDIQRAQSEVEAECAKDDRVLDVAAVVTIINSGKTWRVSIQVTPKELGSLSSFALILAVTSSSALIEAVNQ